MSTDFTSSPEGDKPSETPLFAATPIWERSSKKKRGFGRSHAAAASTTTAAAAPVIAASSEPMMTTHAEPTTTAYEPVMPGASMNDAHTTAAMDTGPAATTTSYTRKAPARRNGGVPAAAIVAGLVALGGLAAAGWYASQPHDPGVAQLTPGAPGEAALSGSPQAATMAVAAPVPAPSPMTTTTTRTSAPAVTQRTTTTRVAAATRTRPAARTSGAASATDLGVNTNATLPDTPQTYGGAATPNPSVIPVTPPVEAAPAPSASSATPATPAPDASATPQ